MPGPLADLVERRRARYAARLADHTHREPPAGSWEHDLAPGDVASPETAPAHAVIVSPTGSVWDRDTYARERRGSPSVLTGSAAGEDGTPGIPAAMVTGTAATFGDLAREAPARHRDPAARYVLTVAPEQYLATEPDDSRTLGRTSPDVVSRRPRLS
ncbi:hypothetical protein ACFSBG_01930 [Georgenia yuyongxinii]|uniref:hypothetical protein n=1 Tax=Georgenia yuyongxinii TaxID=2589797 RepID=UPI00143D8FAB|nr:hypothetical protein [Georgenia yuyongxinii]